MLLPTFTLLCLLHASVALDSEKDPTNMNNNPFAAATRGGEHSGEHESVGFCALVGCPAPQCCFSEGSVGYCYDPPCNREGRTEQPPKKCYFHGQCERYTEVCCKEKCMRSRENPCGLVNHDDP